MKKKIYITALGFMVFKLIWPIFTTFSNFFISSNTPFHERETYFTIMGLISSITMIIFMIVLIAILVVELKDKSQSKKPLILSISNLVLNITSTGTLYAGRFYIQAIANDESKRLSQSVSTGDYISYVMLGQSLISLIIWIVTLILLIIGFNLARKEMMTADI